MSKLYWMSQMIATDSGENITFAPSTTSGLTSTKVSAAIREVATNMTGIIMSKELPAGTTSFSFTNTLFNDDMHVDYYCSDDIYIDFPHYNDSTKTITFNCDELESDQKFRIIVKF